MALVTLAQARAHVRVLDSTPDPELSPYLDGAVDAAQAYLNRAIYETEEALATARVGYAAAVGAAAEARTAAVEAAAALDDEDVRAAALRRAEIEWLESRATADRCIHGVVVNGSIRAAILLIFGHLFENRETVVVGAPVADVPMGAKALLRPYRRIMMP